MTDKYEDFKEWFKNQTEISWRATGCAFVDYDDKLPFTQFEKHYEEKKKEEQIKQIIRDSIIGVPLYPINDACMNELYCSDELVNKLYNELKRKDLIK